MLDYEVLRVSWWALIGILLVGFAITDGYDMGVGIVLPIIGKTNLERRVMINSIAPHWDGNQVWLVTAGGALFAAWPTVYAVAFSGFYFAMIVILAALFFRPLGFDYRGKLDNQRWRDSWDIAICFGNATPALLFGVAFGNIFQGLPFSFDGFMRMQYEGNFFGLVNPFAVLCGCLSLLMFTLQGSAWLQLKTDGLLRERAERCTQITAVFVSLLFFIVLLYAMTKLAGYQLISPIDHAGPSNPTHKKVIQTVGGWIGKFQRHPSLLLLPISGLLMPIGSYWATVRRRCGYAFLCSSLAQATIILSAGITLFPFILPSSLNPEHSLTVWDASSSFKTLSLMFYVALLFVPVVLGYTWWSYRTMWGRLRAHDIEKKSHLLY